MTPWPRTIIHIDMDAFFASVEQRDHPEWQGKPIVVGSNSPRGVVAAASYEARKFGIRSAMPSQQAAQRCADLIFAPHRMEVYQAVSKQVMGIFESYSPELQKLSVDEAFLDISGSMHLWGGAQLLAEHLRQQIKDELQLTCSVGIAPNKFLAKLASDMNKPDGITYLPKDMDAIPEWLAPLDIRLIWGVGKRTEAQLNKYGIRKVRDLQQRLPSDLERMVGANQADHLWRLAHGEDERPIVTVQKDKSISSETTFSTDISDPEILDQTLLELIEKVGRRLRSSDYYAGTVFIKVRYGNFENFTRQCGVNPATHNDRDLIQAVRSLFAKAEVSRPVRLLGAGVSGLLDEPRHQHDPQLDLFKEPEAPQEDDPLDQAVDKVRDKFGKSSLKRGNWKARENGNGE